jgi:pimeloyl-ACP methyl ester carboxylesterase
MKYLQNIGFNKKVNFKRNFLIVKFIFIAFIFANSAFSQSGYNGLNADFSNLPSEKRLSMPLLWLHGEDDATLKERVGRVVDGENNFNV